MATDKTRIYIDRNVWKESQADGSEKWYALHPKTGETVEIDPEQAYFWTEEWQAAEREADEDIAAGRIERYDSKDDFLNSFKVRE